MSPRSVILLLLVSLFSTFAFAKPGWHLVETEDEEGVDARPMTDDINDIAPDDDNSTDEKDSDEGGKDGNDFGWGK